MKKITLTVQQPVEAEVVLRIGDTIRAATMDELLEAGLVSREWLYNRIKAMTDGFFDGDSEAFNVFWHFLEYVAVYTHEPPPAAVESMRSLLATRDHAVRELLFLAGIEGMNTLSRGGKGCVFRAVEALRPDIAWEWEEKEDPATLLRRHFPDHETTSPSTTSSAPGEETEDWTGL